MKVNLKRVDDAFRFETTTEDGFKLYTDASESIGGNNTAARPMQMVLAAVASCSSIDIVHLLNKQRQPLEDIQVDVTAQRADQDPRVFTHIHLHYRCYGHLDPTKVERACRLSMEKMCSVSLMLKGTVEIDWSYEVVEV
ncbi:MAG: OsmC family protein [Bacteroidota bacterium]